MSRAGDQAPTLMVSPLELAASLAEGRVQALELLVEHHADVNLNVRVSPHRSAFELLESTQGS